MLALLQVFLPSGKYCNVRNSRDLRNYMLDINVKGCSHLAAYINGLNNRM